MNLEVIGLGMVGRAMARNLLRAGHRLTVYNRTHSRAEELRSAPDFLSRPPYAASREIGAGLLRNGRRAQRRGHSLRLLISLRDFFIHHI
jgi:shikimate 5-dehydrogenase